MISVRWNKIFRELWGNKARTVLVVLSIAVGVFAVGAIINTWEITLRELTAAYVATNPASAEMSVSAFDEELVQAVEGQREVDQAQGRRSVVMTVTSGTGKQINFELNGIDNFDSIKINQITPEAGAWPPGARELYVERTWLPELDLGLGDSVTVETPDGRLVQLTLAGTVHDLQAFSPQAAEIGSGYVTLETMEYLGEASDFNRLFFTVSGDRYDAELIDAVTADVRERIVVGNGYQVFQTTIPTPPMTPIGNLIITALLSLLSVLGVFSLLLSAGLVVNTVTALITQQIKQIGVMKAVGGRQAQIMEIYIGSVVIFGVLSLIVAVPLGVIGAQGLITFLTSSLNFDIERVGISPPVILLQALVGVVVPAGAALYPVAQGIRITVREAIGSHGLGEDGSSGFFDNLLKNLQGGSVRNSLALRNTFRRRWRTLLTTSVLTLAGAIFVAVFSVRASLFATLDEAVGYIRYDVSVRLGQPIRISQIEREALRVPGITGVDVWLADVATYKRPDGSESTNYIFLAPPASTDFITPTIQQGRWLKADDRDVVVVNADFLSEEDGLGLGDTITLETQGVEREWTIVGIIGTQYAGPVIYSNYEAFSRVVNQVGYGNRVVVRTADSSNEGQKAAEAALDERFTDTGIPVRSTETRNVFVDIFRFRFNVMTVFLSFMAMLLATVGGLGLAGSMGLNVLERIREIGVMRAIGASDRSIIQIVLAEGIVIGGISWVLASVVGYPLARALSAGIGVAFGGQPLTFAYSIWGTVFWLFFALIIAALASYLPARRASRLTVREVLAYE